MNGACLAGARIVVTGAAGFVGSHLCERLIGSGARVTGIDDLSTGCRDNLRALDRQGLFTLVEQDVTVMPALAGPVDAIMHLASPAAPADYLALPMATLRAGSLGTLRMADLARAKDATLLLASTSEIYGDPEEHPQTEAYWGNVNPVGPRSVYDEAKRFAEAVTAQAGRDGVRTAIARIFNTYGPRMSSADSRVVPAFVRQATAGAPLTVAGDGMQTRSLCYIEDTVDGLVRLLSAGFAAPVNIGGTDEITVLDLALLIRDLCGSQSPVQFTPLPQDDPRRRCPDVSLARRVLGWAPHVTLRDGLARTIDWHVRQAGKAVSV